MQNLSLLGSTGSIGKTTLEVVRQNPNRFRVLGLSCRNQIALLKQQILEFKPICVSVENEADAMRLKQEWPEIPKTLEVLFGADGAVAVATIAETDTVVSAMVGAVGLLPTFRAIQAKKNIALANKETLVIAGRLMTEAAKKSGTKILPVDSEHSAIFQVLAGEQANCLEKVILTASGGPFLKKSFEELKAVRIAEALMHPRWKMGEKITIDSATMMNKGLEMIEAKWLFDLRPDQIEICVHPESIVHSMVEYQDGSVLAQLGIADMQIPISYALAYPERLSNRLPKLDLTQMGPLHFLKPDEERFRCLRLAKKALLEGGNAPCILNAANEVAVDAFLNEKISFLEIADLVGSVLDQFDPSEEAETIEDLFDLDRTARNLAYDLIETSLQHKIGFRFA